MLNFPLLNLTCVDAIGTNFEWPFSEKKTQPTNQTQKLCITVTLALKSVFVSHPVLLKLSKKNMVTFEGFLSEAEYLGKKTNATSSANI